MPAKGSAHTKGTCASHKSLGSAACRCYSVLPAKGSEHIKGTSVLLTCPNGPSLVALCAGALAFCLQGGVDYFKRHVRTSHTCPNGPSLVALCAGALAFCLQGGVDHYKTHECTSHTCLDGPSMAGLCAGVMEFCLRGEWVTSRACARV